MSTNKLQIQEMISRVKVEICQKIDSLIMAEKPLNVRLKADQTIVTIVDEFISDLFLKEINQSFPDVSFYSEERRESRNFPVCILDPIDGTKELVAMNGECCVSFGVYFSDDFSDERNFSWIFNPFTGFEISSEDVFLETPERSPAGKPLILVSRSEYNKGLYQEGFDDLNVSPLGSIAFKLGVVSAGGADGVMSLRPKSIWDVAAGIHIGLKRNINFYSEGKAIDKIRFKDVKPPLIFSQEKIFQRIHQN